MGLTEDNSSQGVEHANNLAPNTTEASKKLRVAVLLNSETLLDWQLSLLSAIQHSHHSEIMLGVIRDGSNAPEAVPTGNRVAQSLFHRYVAWDKKKFRQGPDAFKPRHWRELECAAPLITVTPRCTLWSDFVEGEALSEIAAHQIDVIIRLGWRILRGDLLDLPRYGVWSYHHGDNRINRGGPPAVWEIYNDEPSVGVTLQILRNDLDAGHVISRAQSATDVCSIERTRQRIYWKTAKMMPLALEQLHRIGGEAFMQQVAAKNSELSVYSKPLYSEKSLSTLDSLQFVAKNAKRYAKTVVKNRYQHEHWSVYFRLSDALSTAFWQFKKLESPADCYWADPHAIEKDGRFYVFVEEYRYATQKGHIAVVTLNAEGQQTGPAIPVLESDKHLSYPFVFEHEGTYYLLPESAESKKIELYECVEFPHQWRPAKVLMQDVHAVDTTLYQRDGRWWMFTNLSVGKGANTHDELYLFSADTLLTDQWEAHPQNPIVSDIHRARSAGQLFTHNGQTYRPAQDGSREYGYGLRFHAIETLNRAQYEEREVTVATPDWHSDMRGLHTLNRTGRLTLIDAKTRHWRWR